MGLIRRYLWSQSRTVMNSQWRLKVETGNKASVSSSLTNAKSFYTAQKSTEANGEGRAAKEVEAQP